MQDDVIEATYETEERRRLFTVGQITTAFALGAPIAGCFLLSRNYRELGKVNEERKALIWGVVSTALILLISLVLPRKFPHSALSVGYCFAMFQLARRLQGTSISKHLAEGGAKGSWAMTIGVGLASVVVIFILILGFVIVLDPA